MKYLIAVIIIVLFLLQIAKPQTWTPQNSGTTQDLLRFTLLMQIQAGRWVDSISE